VGQGEVGGVEGVVDQLGAQPAAQRPEVQHRVAVGVEDRSGPRHGLVRPADVDGQRARLGRTPAPADGGVDHVHVPLGGGRRDLCALRGADGGVQGEDAARRHARQHASGTEGDVAHGGTVGDADADDVAAPAQVGGVLGDVGRAGEGLERFGPAGPQRGRHAVADHPSSHAPALAPQPDEAGGGHDAPRRITPP
jgi:hypothetical protein